MYIPDPVVNGTEQILFIKSEPFITLTNKELLNEEGILLFVLFL